MPYQSCKGASCTTVSLPVALWITTEKTPQAWMNGGLSGTLGWKTPDLLGSQYFDTPTRTSPPNSFSTATEPGWPVTSNDLCQ